MTFDLNAKNYEMLPNNVLYLGNATLTDIECSVDNDKWFLSLKLVIKDKYYTFLKWTDKFLSIPDFASACATNLMKAIRDNCSKDYTDRVLAECEPIEAPLDCLRFILTKIQSDGILGRLVLPIRIHFPNGFRQIDLYPVVEEL